MISNPQNLFKAILIGRYFWFVSSCNPLFAKNVLAGNKEIIITGGKYITNLSTIYLSKLYADAFDWTGHKFIYQNSPNNKSSVISDQGTYVAGELSRVPGYNTKHAYMIKLDISHYSVRFMATSAEYPRFTLDGL